MKKSEAVSLGLLHIFSSLESVVRDISASKSCGKLSGLLDLLANTILEPRSSALESPGDDVKSIFLSRVNVGRGDHTIVTVRIMIDESPHGRRDLFKM